MLHGGKNIQRGGDRACNFFSRFSIFLQLRDGALGSYWVKAAGKGDPERDDRDHEGPDRFLVLVSACPL